MKIKYLFWQTLENIIPLNQRWLVRQEGFRRYFNNTGWLFFAQIISLLTSFFIGALIARRLGPEVYGILSYALSFTTIFGIFFCFGIDAAMNRELIKYPEKEKELLGTFWIVKIIGGLLTMIVAVGIAFLNKFDGLTIKLIIIFSGIFIVQSLSVISLFFQARVEAKKVSLAQVGSNLFSAALKVIWLIYTSNIFILALIYVVDIFLNSAFLIFYYHRMAGRLRSWSFDWLIFKNIIRSGGLLMFSGLAILAVLKIDQIIIGHIMGKSAVGLYAVADRLTEIWDFIPRLICLSLFAAIINARKTDFTLYKSRLKQLYWLTFSLSIIIMIIVLIISRPLILGLFGVEYADSINILRVYVLSLPGLFLFHAINQKLVAENKEKIILLANVVAMALNIVLNFILLPYLGLIGSAWATVITFIFLPLFMISRKSSAKPIIDENEITDVGSSRVKPEI